MVHTTYHSLIITIDIKEQEILVSWKRDVPTNCNYTKQGGLQNGENTRF